MPEAKPLSWVKPWAVHKDPTAHYVSESTRIGERLRAGTPQHTLYSVAAPATRAKYMETPTAQQHKELGTFSTCKASANHGAFLFASSKQASLMDEAAARCRDPTGAVEAPREHRRKVLKV